MTEDKNSLTWCASSDERSISFYQTQLLLPELSECFEVTNLLDKKFSQSTNPICVSLEAACFNQEILTLAKHENAALWCHDYFLKPDSLITQQEFFSLLRAAKKVFFSRRRDLLCAKGDGVVASYLPIAISPFEKSAFCSDVPSLAFFGTAQAEDSLSLLLPAVSELGLQLSILPTVEGEIGALERICQEFAVPLGFGSGHVFIETDISIMKWLEILAASDLFFACRYSPFNPVGPFAEIAYASGLPVLDLDYAQSKDFMPSVDLRLSIDAKSENILKALEKFFKSRTASEVSRTTVRQGLRESRASALVAADLISLLNY